MEKLRKCFSDQRGQGTVEYLLIIGVIVVAVVFAATKFDVEIGNFINDVAKKVRDLLK